MKPMSIPAAKPMPPSHASPRTAPHDGDTLARHATHCTKKSGAQEKKSQTPTLSNKILHPTTGTQIKRAHTEKLDSSIAHARSSTCNSTYNGAQERAKQDNIVNQEVIKYVCYIGKRA
eukprot:3303613-Amphidinium_carterae.1